MNEITVGLSICKIYDRMFIKRCNKCQGLGHYYKECQKTESTCAKCSGEHRTDECTSSTLKCINCVNNGSSPVNHAAFDHKCPHVVSFCAKKPDADLNA